MKKIKISELPLYNSLKGLFTIGTDDQNRSVKVSLEFVETETNKAVANAEAATTQAINAATNADTATAAANTAKQTATQAAADAKATADAAASEAKNTATAAANTANTAAANANKAADTATASASKADKSAAAADTATKAAQEATEETLAAKTKTEAATEKANTAATGADTAAADALTAKATITAMLQRIIPTGLTVAALDRITVGNTEPVYIQATLTPTDTLPNIIFISDNQAVTVDIDGRMRAVKAGTSRIQVIPTCNVALTKTLLVEVGQPFCRMVNDMKHLRLSASGAFRFT